MLRTEPLVCYDKNVPNLDGLRKLLRVLGQAEKQHRVSVRVVLVLPTSLDHDLAWQRVEGRASHDPALNVHTCAGGREEAYRVFKSVFFDACSAFLPLASQLPGALSSASFWQDLRACRQLANAVLAALPKATPLETLASSVEQLAHGDGLIRGGGAWMCAEIPRTKLHVTLVPPAGSFGRETSAEAAQAAAQAGARTAAMLKLQPHVQKRVRISLLRYHLATSHSSAEAGAEAFPNKRARGRSGLPTPDRQIGFWEVAGVHGLPDDAHYAPQAATYHVTDSASLLGCAPREAAEVLRALRRGELGAEWHHRVLPGAAEDAAEGDGTARPEVVACVRLVS